MFEDIKILYLPKGATEGSVYPLTKEEFNETDTNLTLRERATIIANNNLPDNVEVKILIKEEDRI